MRRLEILLTCNLFLLVHSFVQFHLHTDIAATTSAQLVYSHATNLNVVLKASSTETFNNARRKISKIRLKKKGLKKKEIIIAVNKAVAVENNRDAMISRAAVLRQTILREQLELQKLERQIVCCSKTQPNSQQQSAGDAMELLVDLTSQTKATFSNSLNVLLRKLNRVRDQVTPKNKQYKSVTEFMGSQTATGIRILRGLATNPDSIKHLVDPRTPSLIPHIPSIYARLDSLEVHVHPILEKVLNNRQHLASIEPYFDEIMERFDDIEPHLPWILQNIDSLAPYTGLLLNHVDELLLYAQEDEGCSKEERYNLAEQVLPYLEFYVSRLDIVGPHLPLLRPHLPKLLKHNRIAKVTPHIDRLFARGYLNLGTSANLDVLLWWVGWSLNIPFVPKLFFAIPGSPRFATFLANRLPRRFVRGYCSDISCSIEGDYGANWNRLSKD